MRRTSSIGGAGNGCLAVKITCTNWFGLIHYSSGVRIWWNWQTRYFEVVVGQPVQVQVLLCAPFFVFNYGWACQFFNDFQITALAGCKISSETYVLA